MRLLVGLMSVFGVLQSLHQIQAQYKEKDESGCEFPFKYNGKSYSKCTKGVEKFPWCSYTKEFIGVWKYCYDMKKTIWECKGKCEKYRGDEYPSCKSNYHGRRRYCTEEIKYLADSDATALAEDCPNRYSNTPMHTACLATSKYAVKIGVTDQDKKEIIELHDKWRTNLKEPAKNMMKMSYDEDLAFVAQKHASRCSFAHDQPQQRVMGTGKNPGQNIVKVSGSKDANITEMFEKMYKAESPRWEYGVGIIPKFKKYHQGAGHYTQMLLEHVSKMGCGQAICVYAERKEKIFVCNYDNMQFQHEMVKPYQSGPWCSGCKDKCVQGKLCDCGGRECYNGGKLNPATCECECKGFWQGETCETPIVSEKKKNGCSIPYEWDGQLHYGCMKDPDDYYDYPICSSIPKMTYESIIECKEE